MPNILSSECFKRSLNFRLEFLMAVGLTVKTALS
jgi:hypothetical protein